MSKARLVLTALFVDRQTPTEVAARYGVHRAWVYRLKARSQTEGEAALEPRSRRPKTSPTAIPAATVTLIVELRAKPTSAGLDAGPDTLAWHLANHHGIRVLVSTVSRTLTRAGLVTPAPNKRPKASSHRFPPVRGHPAQPDLAGRLHPLPAHPPQRHARPRHRDPDLAGNDSVIWPR
jgi:transposase